MVKSKKEIHKCYKHPFKEARRRCFQCKKYICPECQIKKESHIFCSEKCIGEFKKLKRKEEIKTFVEKKGKPFLFRLIFYPSIIILLFISFFLYRQWLNSFDQNLVGTTQLQKVKKVKEIDWSSPSKIEILEPKDNLKIEENEIKVEGIAPKESLVGLYINSEKIDAIFSEEGRFNFEKVPLKKDENIIQVRYFDNYGNDAYSKAVIVKLVTKPSLKEIPIKEEPYFNPLLSTFLDLKQAKEGKKQILLTFDGGSNDNATDNIIEVLEKENVKATIFLTGEYIKRYPEKVKKLLEMGNIIGNHTYSHPHLTTYTFNEKQATLTGIKKEVVIDQLKRADEAFKSVTGRNMSPYWRAPFGEKNSEILKWAYEGGYRHIHWTPKLDTLDWVADESSSLFRQPKEILQRIISQAKKGDGFLDGGIILMHLGSERKDELRADTILKDIIRELKKEGYSFVTVEDTKWAKEKEPEQK